MSTTTTPIWDFLTKKEKVNFDIQHNDTVNLHRNMSLKSSVAGFSIKSNAKNDESKLNNMYHYSQLSPLLDISAQNQIDLAQLLLTQYQLSNLSYDKFIANSALLNELRTYTESTNDISSIQYNALNMFTNFLKSYNNYICKTLPLSYDELPITFKPFDDKVDIVLEYMMQISNICEQNIINASPAQFDVYFVPPNDTTDFDKLYIEGMAYSGPNSRYHNRSGLNDIYELFCSQQTRELINELQMGNKRLILLIVRGNEYNTNADTLYLFNKNINKYNLHNETLWNLNSKKDVVCNKSLTDLFNISYHLHPNSSGNISPRIYMYYNGYGERICKRSIVNKLPFLFTGINGKNKINNQILNAFINEKNGFHDFIQYDTLYLYGEYLFGLKYERKTVNDVRKRLLNIPKVVIKNNKVQIREFDDPNNQLYYYLTWTCKMQVFDGEFSEYELRDNDSKEIAIFNSELHEKHSNGTLYVILLLNNDKRNGKPKWNMYSLMTSIEIYKQYGISTEDLPIGSRHIHNNFEQEITESNLNLGSDIIPVHNWNKVKLILSQKFKGNTKPNLNKYNLNNYIRQSIANIRSCKNNLSLIPILRIDVNLRKIICEPLIPIVLPDKNIAISYNTLNKKIVINSVFIDPIDILNKAALVDAYSVNTYKYLLNTVYTGSRTSVDSYDDIPELPMPVMNKNWSVGSNTSNVSLKSITDQTWMINSLQAQLTSVLTRENLKIYNMFTNNTNTNLLNNNIYNNNTTTPTTPSISFTANFSQLPSPISLGLPNLQLPSPLNSFSIPNNNSFNSIFALNQNVIHSNPMAFPSIPLPTTPPTPLLTQTRTPPVIMPSIPSQIITNNLKNNFKNQSQ